MFLNELLRTLITHFCELKQRLWQQIIYERLLRLSAVILYKVKQKVLTMIALFLTNFFILPGPLSLNFKINNGKLNIDSQIFYLRMDNKN